MPIEIIQKLCLSCYKANQFTDKETNKKSKQTNEKQSRSTNRQNNWTTSSMQINFFEFDCFKVWSKPFWSKKL